MPSPDAKELGREIITLPNVLSLLRLLTVPVVVVLILNKNDTLAVIIFVLAAATDFVDGKIARRTRPTYIGTILDPLADRLMLSSAGVALAIRGFLPVWAVTILVGRDLLAVLGSLKYRGRVRVNLVGKAATATLMTGVALEILNPSLLGEAIFYHAHDRCSAGDPQPQPTWRGYILPGCRALSCGRIYIFV